MENSTKKLIQEWMTVYSEYMVHQDITDKQLIEEAWISRTNNLMNYWDDMVSGEQQKIYDSFDRLLITSIDYYQRLNNNYRRNKRIEVTVKGEGGRYWI